ncbi:MAG: hypothetical protein ABI462_14165 [Ignavibacteria bacterium]
MNIKNIFKVDQNIGVSKFRLYLLRFYFALNFVGLGFEAWSEIFTHTDQWKPIPGIAYSFWAAFSLLAILGIIHPLKMLPLLLVQFTYKLIWSLIVAYPLWSTNQLPVSHELTNIMVKGVFIDLLIIPWIYVLRNFILIQKKNKLHSQAGIINEK